ncbi:hypothetical protein [Pseudobutyrivibrio ruminis]|uniref:Uncharacterized protein n=1 Tax=Pseudobutyrivibrio ruminis DSM 9787 TaxID=1123011 RepID=A0A285S8U3_9FIRM|nr:hypothetical protein [Pseudobutyrivibrio ruminis]SOC04018.1 hypothetical protein SAMN02910411_1993 [Pseudobutyrivibrio ruminis DSM 9787]
MTSPFTYATEAAEEKIIQNEESPSSTEEPSTSPVAYTVVDKYGDVLTLNKDFTVSYKVSNGGGTATLYAKYEKVGK